MKHSINGTITLANGRPGAGLTIEAWNEAARRSGLMGKTVTKAAGTFKISFDEREREGRDLRVFFKVYDQKEQLLQSTQNELYWTSDRQRISITLTTKETSRDNKDTRSEDITKALGKLAGLQKNTVDRLLERIMLSDRTHVAMLNTLVRDKIIDEKQRKKLSGILNFYRFSGKNLALTRVLSKKFNSEKELIKLNRSDWQKLITKHRIKIPENHTRETYAGVLTKSIAHTFPTSFLMERVAVQPRKTQLAEVTRISPLMKHNQTIFTNGRINKLNWTGITGRAKKDMQSGLEQLQKLVNTYKYLGLDTIINNRRIAPDKKEGAIARKLTTLRKFYESNPALELRYTEFFGKNENGLPKPDWSKVPGKEREAVRRQLMSYQRVLLLSDDDEVSEKLLVSGLDSAHKIGTISRKKLMLSTDISGKQADRLLKKARDMNLRTHHFKRIIEEIARNNETRTNVDNMDLSVINDLKEIDGYDDMFGLHGYCSCEHCRSIFSPAAYFVDLMHFVEKHISETEVPADHAIRLKTRRTDLWNLELNCENTNTLIPYLAIVNEVLETYISHRNSGKNAYEVMKDREQAFALPFHRPLTEIRTYLKHFDQHLGDLVSIINPDSMHPELLGLSENEHKLIANPNKTLALKLFGVPNTTKMEVVDFLAMTGLSRETLNELLAATYIKASGGPVVKRIKTSDDIQQYKEELQELNSANLDRMHRFIRLYKKLPWSIAELDLILSRLSISNEFTEDAFFSIASLFQLQSTLSLSVDALIGLFSDLPQHYLEQHFISAGFSSPDPEERKAALISGLKITSSELEFLTDQFGISNPEKDDLHQLFRYTKLAKRLQLSVEDFLTAIELSGISTPVTGWAIKDIKTLVSFSEKLKQLPFSIYECRELLQTDTFYYTEEEQNELLTVVAALFSRSFTENDFHRAMGPDRIEESSAALEALTKEGFLEKAADNDSWKVSGAYEWLSEEERQGFYAHLPGDETLKSKLREFLEMHFIQSVLLPLLAEQLQKDHKLVSEIAYAVYGAKKHAEGQAVNPVTDIDRLEAFLPKLGHWLFLSEQFGLGMEFFSFIADEQLRKTVFFLEKDNDDMIKLNIRTIFSLQQYYRFKLMAEDEVDLHSLITSYHNNLFDHEGFAALTDKDPVLVNSVYKNNKLQLPKPVLQAFDKVLQLAEWCEKPGINGEGLVRLYSTTYADLKKAAKQLLAAFRSKYEDDAVLQEALAPYEDALHVAKRDALTAYILSLTPLNFKTRDDLYEYFLLDVDMDGCARTSKVKAAISSLQLYIHRCLMQLEQSEQEPEIMATIDDEGRAEWEWRKNYRIWEANRKVFLYPENYIEPDLRDNKSPQFKELQTELLQREITKEAAEEAYKKYLTQFSELGKLIIAGSYYNTEENCYYFFGRTQTDPNQYFHRTYEPEHSLWSTWEKIELAINAPYISAIKHLGKLFIFWVEKSILEKTKIETAASSPDGFDITIKIVYSYLNEAGSWKNPQKFTLSKEQGAIELKNVSGLMKNKYSDVKIYQKCYPFQKDNSLSIYYRNVIVGTEGKASLYNIDAERKKWIFESLQENYLLSKYATTVHRRLFIKDENNGENSRLWALDLLESTLDAYIDADYKEEITFNKFGLTKNLPKIGDDQVHVVHNSPNEVVITIDHQGFLIHNWEKKSGTYFIGSPDTGYDIVEEEYYSREMIHLSTAITDQLTTELLNNGIDAFLSTKTQTYPEYDISNVLIKPYLTIKPSNPNILPFNGAYGLYYRELYFHIPFLIASHLNATEKYAEAAYWYEKVFNPTAPKDSLVHPDQPSDRVWQHIRFRDQNSEKLKDILTDESSIALYKRDPFNPHAIARLRMNAYQKTIVMKYIDNLLDWGDHLFAQDTHESINEATMLYVLAKDILGDRPPETGACKTLPDNKLTYAQLASAIEEGSEFLIALENKVVQINIEQFIKKNPAKNPKSEVFLGYAEPMEESIESKQADNPENENFIDFETSSLLAFCIPPNKTLLGYWDRVEDRLFKIRHCMNIKGMTRQLALFQPSVDPMMLVKAKAAGLSLTDVIQSLSATPPAYRFIYLIEKAKQFAGTVQGFGSALLSALEKKDMEDLTLLRNTHEQNILTLTYAIKEEQVKEAKAQTMNIKEAKVNVENRQNYYKNLIEKGLTDWETTEQVLRHTSTGLKAVESITMLLASITYLIPQVGSPFAMKYGGKEIGDGFHALGGWSSTLATISDSIAKSAGLEASNQRREQEWKQQKKLAGQELLQIAQQKIAAEIREEIAEKDMEIHQTQTEQAKELYDFYKDKFTNLGLYDHLANTLSSLYRNAYNMALNMAKKAEQAYVYERDIIDGSIMISGSHWQADKAGLLAGEKLMLELQQLESAYMEANTREYEITQTFSLMQLNAAVLVQLKATGSCEFTLPEYAYDLIYPGHYKRRIKSVRLSIPCVTGPYTNVNATLNLLSSQIRRSPNINNVMDVVPKTVVNAIATSTANNDAGVFELNFRDERFLPFEGAGAISDWKLQLPGKFRTFDYKTISDILIHVSYTAIDGGDMYREAVETELQNQLSDAEALPSLPRLFSLKNEFPEAWFTAKEKGAPLSITVDKQMFPFAFQGMAIEAVGAKYIGVPLPTALGEGDWITINVAKENHSWKLNSGDINLDEKDDILLVFEYTVSG